MARTRPPTPTPAYRHRLVARTYDASNAVLWLPTGSDRMRRTFVDFLALGHRARVWEPGCGTGLVTRHLLAAGADVVSLDGAPAMLAAARRRAPGARFVAGDVLAGPLDEPFDRVVLAFVLHELDAAQRIALLQRAAGALAPGGTIGILEWACRARRSARRCGGRPCGRSSPRSPTMSSTSGLEAAIAGAGLTVVAAQRHAGGRARALVLQPDPAHASHLRARTG